ncbi:methyltransferase domain-containing protein [Ruegeria sp. 2012CJ41-6]|uniref:Methyltransferase domain-containing protein n=1 Tax=Ruegeria spongiae TaxID=2942209 RepID=A0ABT0Q891_9RHOB|nr:methyltransferase domain-containing protein [Ruegeria spongiae]MCL6285632.1 methyltransferase domain-containing protein [Ruegeria spongiae]
MKILSKLARRTAEAITTNLRPYDMQRLAKTLAERARPADEIHAFHCPLCGYQGQFDPIFGSDAMRFSSECPDCHSRERHRFLKLWMDGDARCQRFGRFLHFAPEPVLTRELKPKCDQYQTADIEPGRADLELNMEDLALEESCIDTIMANHVLEHVNDSKALPELRRVLRPGGFAILTTPVIPAWGTSYENPAIRGSAEQHLHFGQYDHVRIFGADLADRIRAAGFDLDVITADGEMAAQYATMRGDAIYVATRPAG